MAAWPAALPRALVTGYQLAQVDPVVRTDMEAGAARARRRSSARNDQVTVAWHLSASEMAAFRAWFDDDAAGAAGGAAWFDVSLDLGAGETAAQARFAAIWQAERLAGGRWRVSARLEVR